MSPLKHKRVKSCKPLNKEMMGNMRQIEQSMDTMDIDGITYFPCRTCNRLFKDEKLAMCHFKKCKPRVYLVTNEELENKSTKTVNKDPYEIIPEEIELEGQLLNNNTSNENKNGTEKYTWRKNSRKCKNNNDKFSKNLDKNHTAVNIATSSSCTNKPMKDIIQTGSTTLESHSFASRTEETMLNKNIVKTIEKPTSKTKKIINIEKTKRNYRQLTEQEIEERLKKISDQLKKHKQPESKDEEEEEEERREIEERLSVLNKQSQVCMQNTVEESGARLKERKYFPEPPEESMENCQVSVSADIFGDISENNGVQKYIGNMKKMRNERLTFQKQNTLHPESKENGVVVITQRPDGQLHACRKCSQVFLSALELLRHSRREHTYPRIIMAPEEISKFMSLRDRSHCPICEKPLSSTYKSIYLKHLQTHSCILEHICPICKKKFKRRDHMRAHQKRHIVGNNAESTELHRNSMVHTEDLHEFVDYPEV